MRSQCQVQTTTSNCSAAERGATVCDWLGNLTTKLLNTSDSNQIA